MGALSRIQGVFSRDDDEGELDRGISGGPGAVGYDAQAGGGRRGSGRSRGCLGSTLDHERRSRIVDYALREAQASAALNSKQAGGPWRALHAPLVALIAQSLLYTLADPTTAHLHLHQHCARRTSNLWLLSLLPNSGIDPR